ncbi:benzoate/H(+) symporter BenE family transporter [Chromobacterium subtsugae]|uniref:Benzoate/H(+) symporter BenE family transporter n=1 Tax=Chromobacterium subtsugae TaxID=251747 RepID=A0ABS7F7M1_9NEIS|nr:MULTISPECIES: benzoate/H(+) symporter BenE family transporter [Chromobacterium]KUM01842.1 benzoate transporter [Chromobacterium subtsugae]KZE83155.1 benzoate transporter [Chromobacterium sp. F49]MBW7567114.1 benzoate/H(+) symporter BenE family transporter [Chromobacterium subtsugae]MBW8286084.1 benzoate/H(+) symporter BenE family transporter [Chromobacterium subtsugae]WSE91860.1 benzoate/H(+) symporter BenE family transporter [Chromobacterium subtsugae]
MWQTLRRDAAPSALLAAVLALLVGFSGPFLIIVHAAQSAGLSQAQLASWVWAVSIGSGAAGLWLSLRWKTPVIAAWSTPGAALLLAGLPGVPYPEAVGAFLAAAAIVTLVGASGLFDRLMALFPPALAAALLAGILFHFVGEVVAEAASHLGLVLTMAALFFIGRRWFPRWGLLAAIAAGAALSAGELHAPAAGALSIVAVPLFTWPAWSWSAFINLALPLALLALTSQFLPGMAVLRAFGYQVPARSPVTALGLASVLTAPFGGHGVTLAAIIAAICTGPEAHPDRSRRYVAGVFCGLIYIVMGALGGALAALALALPKALLVTAAGLALFGTLASSLGAALADAEHRESALLTFVVAASGVSFAGLGAPLWAMLAGGLLCRLLTPGKSPAQKAETAAAR